MANKSVAIGILLLITAGPSGGAYSQDTVEFLSGAKARGTVKQIRKDKREFDFEVQLGSRTTVRTYSFDKVHAVVLNGKRHVLTQKDDGDVAENAQGSGPFRTRKEVLELIDRVGRTPPDWFHTTELNYPETLDLTWPLKPPEKGWNNRKNVGQYKWDIINPNPGRWQSGVRLVHKVMALHENNPELLRRDMQVLGEMYFELFQDYARAAFWLRKAGVEAPAPQSIHLAECYWRLGNKQMALEMLKAKRLPMNAIKLLGDMGQFARAGRMADSFGRAYPDRAHEPYLLAGDAFRLAGQFDKALDYYRKVLAAGQARNEEYQKRYAGRAQDSIEAIQLFEKTDISQVTDGTYAAESTGYNGPLEVEVQVANGKIVEVEVTKHREKQFYAALTDTPGQILKKQSVKGIDATSRATITSQAIVNSAAKALAKGAGGE